MITRTPTTCEGALADLDSLIEDFDAERAARYSFRDYHARGLTYINLQFAPEMIVKLYILRPRAVRLNADGFLVGPHDHAYDFATFVLDGDLTHHTFDPRTGAAGDLWHEFAYSAPVRGGKGFERRGLVPMTETTRTVIPSAGHYRIDSRTVHTISVDPNNTTALLLYQQPDKRTANTWFFSRSPEAPSTEGLYGHLTAAEIAREIATGVEEGWLP